MKHKDTARTCSLVPEGSQERHKVFNTVGNTPLIFVSLFLCVQLNRHHGFSLRNLSSSSTTS